MPQKVHQEEQSLPPLPEDHAWSFFMAMDVAQARGEFAKAAEFQRKLRELGWVVTRRRSRPAAEKAVAQ